MGSPEHAKTELFSLSTLGWEISSPFFNYTEVFSFAAFSYQNEFYVLGGRTKNIILSLVAKLYFNTGKWTQIGSLNFARFGHKISVINDKLIIIGGSKIFEHCKFYENFSCSTFGNITFTKEETLISYASYPSECKTGKLRKMIINIIKVMIVFF